MLKDIVGGAAGLGNAPAGHALDAAPAATAPAPAQFEPAPNLRLDRPEKD